MKFISTLLLTLMFLTTYCQETPYMFEDTLGHQFVVLSVEQARILDNSTEYSPIFWENVNSTKILDSVCSVVITKKEFELNEFKSLNTLLTSENKILTDKVSNNQLIIDNLNKRLELVNQEKKFEIQIRDKKIERQKLDFKVVGLMSAFSITGLLIVIFAGS